MKRNKPNKAQQFSIKRDNPESKKTPALKGTIQQFTSAQKAKFELDRAKNESVWSKIDNATIDRECNQREVWD